MAESRRQRDRGQGMRPAQEVACLIQAVERERCRGVRRATNARDKALLKLLVEAGLRLAQSIGTHHAAVF